MAVGNLKRNAKGQRPKNAGRATGLTPKRLAFVDAYLASGGNATEAARAVGVKETSAPQRGSQLLHTPCVADEIARRRKEVAIKANLTTEWVIQELRENVAAAQLAGDYGPANKALELLGKHLGMFGDKLQIDFKPVADLTDEELEQKARTLRLVS
jgi:phage terminase small subunit